jgi:predicted aspartyl protease
MIYGVVNLRREATLPLVVANLNGQQQVIDTGFSGFLSLPFALC